VIAAPRLFIAALTVPLQVANVELAKLGRVERSPRCGGDRERLCTNTGVLGGNERCECGNVRAVVSGSAALELRVYELTCDLHEQWVERDGATRENTERRRGVSAGRPCSFIQHSHGRVLASTYPGPEDWLRPHPHRVPCCRYTGLIVHKRGLKRVVQLVLPAGRTVIDPRCEPDEDGWLWAVDQWYSRTGVRCRPSAVAAAIVGKSAVQL
jgi:hypothetical protein